MDGSGGKQAEFRAAQYVRMSTEHQQYSTQNQAQIIQDYEDTLATLERYRSGDLKVEDSDSATRFGSTLR